jgi:NADH-ubiquinone oxidoreductase chain 5
MEAPTPVSALLHAATLVTAGIYLLLRCSPILEYSPTALMVITIVGASTAFFAATSGLVQNDLKRIIAFSTISQLGYMVMAIGLSQYNVALFHTVNHAFFKALLFLAAGAVIHSFSDQQDVRKMGGLIKFLPFTYSVMLVGTLSLLATPFLSGFYSKDLIIELAYGNYNFSQMYAFILGSITAGITAFYSFRLISLVFLTLPNGNKQSYLNSHESGLAVIIPLLFLSLCSIFFGYLFSDMFVGMASDFFGNSLFIHPNNITLVEAEYSLSILIKLLPSILSLIGASSALIFYIKAPEIIISLTETSIGKKLYTLFNSKYYFDVIYNNYVFSNGFKLGYSISKLIDRGVIELVGPYGLSNSIFKLAKDIAKLDSGVITTYALYITIGFLFFLFVLFTNLILDQNINEIIRLFIILSFSIFALRTPKSGS